MSDEPAGIRVDPISGLRVVVAPSRSVRPGAAIEVPAAPPLDAADDPFAEGHEDRTPPETGAIRPGGGPADTPGWLARAVPNLYPTLDHEALEPEADAQPDLFPALPARGAHEVIVNAPHAAGALADLDVEQVVTAARLWRERMRAHQDAAYVHLSVNEQDGGGASLAHTHAQLFALDFVPALVARERERFGAHAARTMGGNLLADVVQEEVRRRVRLVAYDDEAVLLAPWASRVPYQLMVVPRTPRPRFDDDGPPGVRLLHDGLARLARRFGRSPPLNLWVRTAPRGAEHFCWRIDVLPRLTPLGALELGVDLHVNTVAPEQVAAELREA